MNNDISNVTVVSFSPVAREVASTKKSEGSVDSEQVKKTKEQDANETKTFAEVTSLDDAKKLVDEGNEILKDIQRNLQFKMDDSTQRIVMSIVDNNTGETIRQVPTEDVLALAKRMQESDGKSGSIEGYIA